MAHCGEPHVAGWNCLSSLTSMHARFLFGGIGKVVLRVCETKYEGHPVQLANLDGAHENADLPGE